MPTMWATQLARVQTPTPRLLPLVCSGSRSEKTDTVALHVVAQIRPIVLHYVRDGVLMCVVTSSEEITGVAQCDGSTPPRLVVTTRSGVLWLVPLPSTPRGLQPLVLKAVADQLSTSSNPVVRRLGVVAGAQQLQYVASLDALVCTSLLVPTTVVHGLLDGSNRSEEEVDDLEGERSTCLCVLASDGDATHQRLATWLLERTPRTSPTALVIVQGDTDGIVRCAVVEGGAGVNGQHVQHVQELVRLPEAITTICPVRLENGVGTDALLVASAHGSIVLLSHGSSHAHALHGRLETRITSMAFLDGDVPSLLVSTVAMKILTVSMTQLVAQLRANASAAVEPMTFTGDITEDVRVQDVLSICAHGGTNPFVSLLTRSGRLLSMARDQFLQHDTRSATDNSAAPPTDLRVKGLLQDISRLSEKASKLQKRSERADALLRGLNTALQLVRLVQEHGIDSVVSCSLGMKLVDAGWAMESKAIRLHFGLHFLEPLPSDLLVATGMWRLQLTVSSSLSDSVSSYGFALRDCVQERERCIELDANVLQQRDGVVQVSCELVFAPRVAEPSTLAVPPGTEHSSPLLSFAIPILQAKEFHLVQLSEPVSDFPTNPAAIREQFTQANVSDLSRALQQGHQWWATLFEDATAAGIAFPMHDVDDTGGSAAPPLRIVTRISMGKPPAERESTLKEEDVVSILSRLMNIVNEHDHARWRAACRHLSGKWWVGMRTFSGNLIVLRFAVAATNASSEPRSGDVLNQRCVELTAHTSNTADLAAIRALILQTLCATNASSTETQRPQLDVERASVALMHTRAELSRLAAMSKDVRQKAESAGISGHRQEKVGICQDELLQLLRRAGQVETRTLELYWKTREVLGQHLTL